MDSTAAASPPHAPRWRRRLGWTALGLGTTLVALVALAPTIVSTGVADGLLSQLVAARTGADEARVEGLTLAWFGAQGVDRLALRGQPDPAGATRVDAAATIDRGLWSLLTDDDLGTVTLTAALEGVRRPDGSLSVSELLPAAADDAEGGATPETRVTLQVDRVDLTVHDPRGEPLALRGLTGRVAVAPAKLEAQLAGAVQVGDDAARPVTGRGSAARVADAWGGELQVAALPSALVDALAGADGVADQALGPTLDVEASAEPAGDDTRVRLRVDGERGHVRLDAELSPDGLVRIHGDDRLEAQVAVAEPLQRHLLYFAQPLLADVRSGGTLQVEVAAAELPLNGDLDRARADVTLALDEVQLDAGGQLLRVLALAHKPGLDSIRADLGRLHLKLRGDRLSYQDFAVRVGRAAGDLRQTLYFSGQVDVDDAEVLELVGLYPVDALANSFKELEGIPAGVSAGLTFHGPLFTDAGEPAEPDLDPELRVDVEELFSDQVLDRLGDDLPAEAREPAGDAIDRISDALGDLFGDDGP